MAQSVELILDDAAELALVEQWERLGNAGLPTSRRIPATPHHRPHITLYAAEVISAEADQQLAEFFAEVDPPVRIGRVMVGALMLFGPRRDSYVLVRQVLASAALLEVQQEVAAICSADPHSPFGPGRWSPHVTLARRIRADQVPPALRVLEHHPDLAATVVRCRRWDGNARDAWWLA